MAAYDFLSVRLFVDSPLGEGQAIALDKTQQNYLSNVLRLKAGERILVFNGREGEFAATIAIEGKRVSLVAEAQTRPQTPRPGLRWLFAPLKHARLDYMVQKAVEMGVGTIEPVITRRTQVSRVNLERMQANAIEAAEQCGVISVPEVAPEQNLLRAIENWDPAVHLVFCDESAALADPLATLAAMPKGPVAVLIGPEGGFEDAERQAIARVPSHTRLSLGPRILRADTAAVAALALIQAAHGDWRAV
ncbi:ribosomal RNA small subunit methyltransferase E [Labrys miyagiensis]|uniref:Ribosomal RNA small subunit methyltransferase E n=1 Tax=Labrys miyagiensis TaxID=346912 RepID=A0ABQ6CQD1_9HYPH|nr:16S rRNA (uracil(1498)-N(3))-methyltransferase [Labrys miyagiensis]GLS22533.1 ribosomal RNA small subunit methyltransferase E [Labrys miyagiensis]